jgi:hypothetical protein
MEDRVTMGSQVGMGSQAVMADLVEMAVLLLVTMVDHLLVEKEDLEEMANPRYPEEMVGKVAMEDCRLQEEMEMGSLEEKSMHHLEEQEGKEAHQRARTVSAMKARMGDLQKVVMASVKMEGMATHLTVKKAVKVIRRMVN